ncbi:MAG: sigma-70 family RNA polymerase sigma factor [Bacteroidota bacterium]
MPASPSPDAIVQHHADLVYRVVLSLLRDPDEAADAAQEALVKVWKGCTGIPAASLRAWCARVARNAALDHLRRRKVRPQPAKEELPEPTSASPLPDARAEAAELDREIDRALDTLGEPYRSIVVLREIEGLAYQEVADTLDLPLNTMKVYLHRAKRRLREAIAQRAPELVP